MSEGDQKGAESHADFLRSIDGFGASYNREDDCWHVYTMPGTEPFCVIRGYDKPTFDAVISVLRFAHAEARRAGHPRAIHAEEDLGG